MLKQCFEMYLQTAGWVVEDCGITLPALCMAKPAPTDEPANLTAPDGCQMVCKQITLNLPEISKAYISQKF